MIIKLHNAAGLPVLVNMNTVALIQQDEDGDTEILFVSDKVGNLLVPETIEEIEIMIHPHA